MAKMVCQAGPDAGHEYPLATEKTVFGRRSGCEVQIMDSMASREHFQVRRDGKLFTLVDLESRNGTKVNDRKVTERQLEFGDRVRVGEVEWIFVKEDGDVELRDLLTSKYEIIEKIGEGGMGVVYKAKQRSMDRTVALKILASKYASRPKFVERFIEEARAAGRLNHPNVIQVHDVDTENGIHYFSMEFIEGGTCMQLLRSRGPFPPGEALEVARLTAKALQYAHENRLIHRDVKPDNIMVGANNMVKLADLGISKTFEEAEAEDRPKKVVGTPHYMAPEAAMGKKIDHRIDIYALGATLYHMLAGTTPFHAKSATSVLKAHIKEEPKPLEEERPDLPKELYRLVAKMMAKKPDDRFQSMNEVMDAIRAAQDLDGLQPDLPSGGDTLMLRRFAAGEASGTGTGTDPSGPQAKPKAGGTTGGSATATRRAGSGTRGRDREQGPAAIRWVLTLVVVVLGLLLAWQVIKMLKAQLDADDEQQQQQQVDTGPTQAEIEAQRRREQAEERERLRVTQSGELRRLGERLDSRPEEATLRAIGEDLDRLSANAADDDIRDGVVALRARLDQMLDTQLAANEQDAFRQLRSEVERLRADQDYEAALSRLAAFKVRRSDDVQRQVGQLEESLRTERDNYMRTMESRVQALTARGDVAGLRRLRDEELPAALVDHQIAKDINAALQKLERERVQGFAQAVDDAREALVEFDHAGFEEVVEDHRAEMGATKPGQDLDALVELAKGIRTFTAALDAEIKAKDRKPRYREILNGIADADIIGCTEDHLILRPPSGGSARVPLNVISEDELRKVTVLVFGEQAAAEHDGIIGRISQLRQQAGR